MHMSGGGRYEGGKGMDIKGGLDSRTRVHALATVLDMCQERLNL